MLSEHLLKIEGVRLFKEESFRIPTPVGQELLKPDLVVINERPLHVVDVTVRYENGDSLTVGYEEKVRKYSPLAEHLRRQVQVEQADVIPIVVGSRGANSCKEEKSLKSLVVYNKGLK